MAVPLPATGSPLEYRPVAPDKSSQTIWMLLPLARMSSLTLLAPAVTCTGGTGLVAGPTLVSVPGWPCIWSPLLSVTVRLMVYVPPGTQNVVALVYVDYPGTRARMVRNRRGSVDQQHHHDGYDDCGRHDDGNGQVWSMDRITHFPPLFSIPGL